MLSLFAKFHTPKDVSSYIDNNEKLMYPICDNIVVVLNKCLDPLEDDYVVYDRNQATVLGIFVKQFRLFQSFVKASKGNDIADTIIFQRIQYEAYVKMQYLIKYGEDAQKEYRLCSYKNRYKLYQNYKAKDNPVARIAIEKFKLDVENEDFSIDDVADAVEKRKSFGGKNFAQIVEEFGQKEFYVPIYGYLSDSVHSDWGESRQLFLQEIDESSFVYYPQKNVPIPVRQLVAQGLIMLESSFVFFDWLESIGKKHSLVSAMESILKEHQRVLLLIMENIFENYKSDKYLYE